MRSMLRFATVLALFVAASGAAQQGIPVPQVWTGRIIPAEGVDPGLTAEKFELRVNRLSTEEEVLGLLEELRIGGQQGLWNAMRFSQSKGFLRLGKLAATEVMVIRAMDLENGRRLVRVYCDFQIRLYDKSEPLDRKAHPFAFLELEVDSTGQNGTGRLIAAASLRLGEQGLEIDNAATPPMNVVDVVTDAPPRPRG